MQLTLRLAAVCLLSSSTFFLQDAAEKKEEPKQPITVIALRHAEKEKARTPDPGLTEVGEARAKDLARLLEHAGVRHLYSTPYIRTRSTLEPLAELTGIEIEPYSPRDLGALEQKLRDLPSGSVAVVAGHSNTTPQLVRVLGSEISNLHDYGGMKEVLGEEEYNRLFLTTRTPSGQLLKTLELRYGS